MAATFLLLQLASTLFMTGLIWFVQIVHYPLFTEVGVANLNRYETLHANRTTWVVFPPMLLELLTTLALLDPALRPRNLSLGVALLLNGLVGAIWLTTALGHVPLHTRLARPAEDHTSPLALLVRLNWLRTVAWTLRSAILLAIFGGLDLPFTRHL